MVRLLTLTEEQRPSGEQDKLATTAFSFPEDVPEMLGQPEQGQLLCIFFEWNAFYIKYL